MEAGEQTTIPPAHQSLPFRSVAIIAAFITLVALAILSRDLPDLSGAFERAEDKTHSKGGGAGAILIIPAGVGDEKESTTGATEKDNPHTSPTTTPAPHSSSFHSSPSRPPSSSSAPPVRRSNAQAPSQHGRQGKATSLSRKKKTPEGTGPTGPSLPGYFYARFRPDEVPWRADPAVVDDSYWDGDGGMEHRLSAGHLDDGDYPPGVFRWMYRESAMSRRVSRRERKAALLGCLSAFVRRFGPGTAANVTVIPASGTLLGTVRNGRMIPWDSDIDILLRTWELPRLREAMLPLRAAPGTSDCLLVDHATFLSPLAHGWIPRIPARIYAMSTGHFIDVFGLYGDGPDDDEFTHLLSRDRIAASDLGALSPCTFEGIGLSCYSGVLPILAAEGLCGGSPATDCEAVLEPNHRWDKAKGHFVKV